MRQQGGLEGWGQAGRACWTTNFRLHLWQILRKVSQAMSWTPGCVSCMNSNSLFTTVFRNFQWLRRKRGYCPTTYLQAGQPGSRPSKLSKTLNLGAQHCACRARVNVQDERCRIPGHKSMREATCRCDVPLSSSLTH